MFYYSTCCVFLAIAFVRYRACEYRGQASVLLTLKYALKTLLICFTPAGMFSTAILSLMINNNHSNVSNDASDHGVQLLTGGSKIAYEISHIIVFIICPIFLSAMMYFRICNVVTQTARTMEGSISNRKHDPAKLITSSVTVLLSTMFTIWGIYTTVRVVDIFVDVDELFFIYCKLVGFIVQPAVEGMLHKTGKKSTPSTLQRLSHARSTRQIYPIGSAALSASMIEELENSIVGTKLPVLMEEHETQAKTSDEKENLHTQMETDRTACKKKTVRVRRQSFIHPRTSVVIRNAALIGLEYQSKINTLDSYSKNTSSPGKLNSGERNTENDTVHRTRRLSNCLRFSTDGSNPSFDEIYHSYKTLYHRRGSEKSTKSHNSNDCENSPSDGFKKCQGRKISTTSSEGSASPSQRRWKKLYTTAKTARKFSTYRKGPPALEEGHAEDTKSRLSTVREKEHTVKPGIVHEEQTFSVPSFYLEEHRRSLDSNSPSPNAVRKQTNLAGKKRSISCISNVWMKNNHTTPSRKKSVSFVSNVDVDGPSMSEERDATNMTRSISYDSKIRISYRKESEEKTAKKLRHSQDHKISRHEHREKRDIEKWLSDRATTRKECIAKLMEMKEYF